VFVSGAVVNAVVATINELRIAIFIFNMYSVYFEDSISTKAIENLNSR
jgi:hypothetical protein